MLKVKLERMGRLLKKQVIRQWCASYFGALSFLLLSPFSAVYAVSVDWDNLGVANLTNIASGQVAQSLDDAGNCTITPPFTDCQVEATITFELNNDGNGGQLNCGFGGNNCVRYYNDQIGGITDGDLRLAVDATAADSGQDDMRMCIEFNREVLGLQFDILDVDDASWDDSVELTYVPFVNSTPMLSRTDLINGVGFGDLSTGTDANHVIEHDPAFAAPDNEVLGWGAIQAPPAGNATAADDGGNISIDFGTQQVGGFCIRYFAGPNSTANPGFQWIALSQLTWTTTLAVDLAHVESTKTGRNLEVEWSTSAESFNLGFNIWGEKDGEWTALHRNVLPSKVVDAVSTQVYSKRIRLSREFADLQSFGISSVDVLGSEEFYGPFEVGERYGESVLPEPIDWATVSAQHTERMRARGFVLRNGRWRKANAVESPSLEGLTVNLAFSESGMARVHHAELLAAGVDLRGVPKSQIAISHQGQAMVRRVGKTAQGLFTEQSFLDFYVAELSAEQALYNANNVYQVSTDSSLVRKLKRVRANSDNAKVESFATQLNTENDALYVNLSKADSPWMENSYGLGATKSTEFELALPSNYLPGSNLLLEINLHGGFDHPSIEQDHIATVSVNGVEQTTRQWAGIEPIKIELELDASLISAQASNTVTVEGVPNSAGFALQYFDNYSLSYVLSDDSLVGVQGFSVAGDGSHLELPRAQVRRTWAYAVDAVGNLVGLRATRSRAQDNNQLVRQYARSSDDSARYFILKNEDFLSADNIVSLASVDTQVPIADLYIITHPSFIGEQLTAYANHKAALGISTEVVDYLSLVDTLGHGVNDPLVVREFLKNQDAAAHGSAALLVGGHSFDYLDRLEQGSVSFIPTAYRPSSVINYSPTDTPLTDTNSDGLSDVAIGRWPVRTLSDLNIIIAKSTAWGNGEGLASSSSVLLIAENEDQNSGISFAQQLNDLSSRYDLSNPHQGGFWGDTKRLYASDFADSETPVTDHKSALVAELEAGHAMTVFNGHGSTNSWTYSGLFRASDITTIQDQGKASIYFPLACYTTYYETVGNNSLAHQLLFKPQGGAVMLVGASTLGDFTSNGRIADRVMQSQIDDQLSLGGALMTAKRAMGVNRQEAANLWTMLGDPTLRFNPSFSKPVDSADGISEQGE